MATSCPETGQDAILPPHVNINTNINTNLSPPTTSTLGIAFVILLHNLKTIKTALISIELLQSPKNYFVIHADRKVPKEDLEYLQKEIKQKNLKNIQIISTQSAKWGGKELVTATLDGITRAFYDYNDWHYMVLISGDCIPIKSLDYIQEKLVNYWPKNSLATLDEVVLSREQVNTNKQQRFKIKDGETFDGFVKGMKNVYYGTQWVTLTREVVHFVLTDPFPRNVLVYLAATHTDLDPATGFPSTFDESYFQIVVMNSPFKNKVGTGSDCIRFEKWGGCKYMHEDHAVPCMLGEDDIPEFSATQCLFARKFVFDAIPSIITEKLNEVRSKKT